MIPPVLSLLLAGHLLADFALQPHRLVARKDRWSGILGHGAILFVVHLAALAPYLVGSAADRIVLGVGGAVVLHMGIDRIKHAWMQRHGHHEAGPFFADQAAHVLTLLALWAWLGDVPTRWDGEHLRLFVTAVAGLGALSLVWIGGISVVRVTLRGLPGDDGSSADDRVGAQDGGKTIGVLERLVVLLLVATGHVTAIAIVLAAKSIARFEELKERRFAEYYLVGTLASFLVALAAGFYLLAAAGTLP